MGRSGAAAADSHSDEGGEPHEEPAAAGEEAAEPRDESGELAPFGLDLEHPALVTAGALASLGLAAAVLRSRSAEVAVAAAVFAAGFAALDVVEALHQADEGNTALTATAWALAAAHAAAAALAVAAITAVARPARPATTN